MHDDGDWEVLLDGVSVKGPVLEGPRTGTSPDPGEGNERSWPIINTQRKTGMSYRRCMMHGVGTHAHGEAKLGSRVASGPSGRPASGEVPENYQNDLWRTLLQGICHIMHGRPSLVTAHKIDLLGWFDHARGAGSGRGSAALDLLSELVVSRSTRGSP